VLVETWHPRFGDGLVICDEGIADRIDQLMRVGITTVEVMPGSRQRPVWLRGRARGVLRCVDAVVSDVGLTPGLNRMPHFGGDDISLRLP